MCGIAGIVNHRGDPTVGDVISAMNAALTHRGPDAAGTYFDAQVAFGHRRLSIIDLQNGTQPATNEDGTVIVVYNGEIYNFQYLREKLLARGHTFRTSSDTEVIVHLYEELGGECTRLLDGMFAFAAYNTKTRRVLLARDRLGQKPLLYFVSNGMLVFASEFSALKCHPAMPTELDVNAVSDYLSFQYVPGTGTIYRGVHKLAPGHQLEFRLDDNTAAIGNYWKLDYSQKTSATFEDSAQKLRVLVTEAVKRRLVADVPVGTFLSGGVDSTIVTAIAAAERHPGITNAYTIGFADAKYDERSFAELAAGAINQTIGGGLHRREKMVNANDFALLEKLAAHCGEPYADASILPTALLAEFAASEVKVALSGDGADEVFCGYERYLALRYASRFSLLPVFLQRPLLQIAGSLIPDSGERTRTGRLRRFLRVMSAPAQRRYFTLLDRCEMPCKRAIFGEKLQVAANRNSAEIFDNLSGELSSPNRVERLAELDLHTYMPGDILTKVDIASMAFSLEVRSPFLDRDVVEFAAQLPLSYKLHGSKRKHILCEAFKDILPGAIANRPKRGFGVPIAAYLRGEWHKLAEQALFDGKLCNDGYFNRDALMKLWQEHACAKRDHSYLLWSLLIFSLFLENNSGRI
ncbi:MAG: asparagine synthase (glutamine-hydrolyzing) [Victivallales bacterium]|jgi:asparagine synthase (glutamine-hydrolysing)|nr:asparagine synthase (glutamine-hydrolyzing) [Victivallales bacterium]